MERAKQMGRQPIVVSRFWLLLVFVPLIAAILILGQRLDDALSTIDHQQVALKTQRAAQQQNHHVLSELCRTNEIVLGLVRGTETLFKYQTGILPPPITVGPNPPLGKPLVNRRLVPYYLNALNTFLGWDVELQNQTACERIKRP